MLDFALGAGVLAEHVARIRERFFRGRIDATIEPRIAEDIAEDAPGMRP